MRAQKIPIVAGLRQWKNRKEKYIPGTPSIHFVVLVSISTHRHNAVRGHRTGSSSRVEDYVRRKNKKTVHATTETNRKPQTRVKTCVWGFGDNRNSTTCLLELSITFIDCCIISGYPRALLTVYMGGWNSFIDDVSSGSTDEVFSRKRRSAQVSTRYALLLRQLLFMCLQGVEKTLVNEEYTDEKLICKRYGNVVYLMLSLTVYRYSSKR